LVMGSKSLPSALDDALAKKIGAKDINDLMSMAQSIAIQRAQELEKRYLSDQIAKRLIAGHKLEIPSWLSGFEAQLLAKQFGNSWSNISDDHKKDFIALAVQNVKLSIILDKIRESEPDSQLSDEEVLDCSRLT
jgi:FKBP-type peptidyl-prolyl cis-trans isomerase (trigger factor)